MMIPVACLESLRHDDQFIVSYPRSGNRWLRMMVGEMILRAHPHPPAGRLGAEMLPDLHHLEALEAPLGEDCPKRVFKSHNIRALAGRRMVYLFRRPADALISFHHFRTEMAGRRGETVALSANDFCLQMLPGWVEHVQLALDQRTAFPERTLFISYERMKREPIPTLRDVAAFLALPGGEETLRSVVEQNTFEKNRAEVAPAARDKFAPVLRRGEIGTAASELPPETLAEIERAAAPLYTAADREA